MLKRSELKLKIKVKTCKVWFKIEAQAHIKKQRTIRRDKFS